MAIILQKLLISYFLCKIMKKIWTNDKLFATMGKDLAPFSGAEK